MQIHCRCDVCIFNKFSCIFITKVLKFVNDNISVDFHIIEELKVLGNYLIM